MREVADMPLRGYAGSPQSSRGVSSLREHDLAGTLGSTPERYFWIQGASIFFESIFWMWLVIIWVGENISKYNLTLSMNLNQFLDLVYVRPVRWRVLQPHVRSVRACRTPCRTWLPV
jgi:hypothetical protein